MQSVRRYFEIVNVLLLFACIPLFDLGDVSLVGGIGNKIGRSTFIEFDHQRPFLFYLDQKLLELHAKTETEKVPPYFEVMVRLRQDTLAKHAIQREFRPVCRAVWIRIA